MLEILSYINDCYLIIFSDVLLRLSIQKTENTLPIKVFWSSDRNKTVGIGKFWKHTYFVISFKLSAHCHYNELEMISFSINTIQLWNLWFRSLYAITVVSKYRNHTVVLFVKNVINLWGNSHNFAKQIILKRKKKPSIPT